ncbi:MAG TPA: response regulator [Thermoanaerobaculia bacterium]|nr:response regulator [Thermoanaerobaculia bacterium]
MLIVDDDEDMIEIFSEFLRLWGHETRTVGEATMAVVTALAFLPEVVLLDLSMPVLDGCEIARRMRRHGSLHDTFLVAVTGHGLQRDVDRALAAGFDMHLLKPVDPQQLRALLTERPLRRAGAARVHWQEPGATAALETEGESAGPAPDEEPARQDN